jgi:phosphate uptake regulator
MKKLDELKQSNQQIPKETVNEINQALNKMRDIALAMRAEADKIIAEKDTDANK